MPMCYDSTIRVKQSFPFREGTANLQRTLSMRTKPTLIVKVVDGCATHTDTDQAIAQGNVFDFASLHFGLSGQVLNEKLNEELHLRIGQKNGFYEQPEQQAQVVVPEPPKPKAPVFSYFKKPVTNITQQKRLIWWTLM